MPSSPRSDVFTIDSPQAVPLFARSVTINIFGQAAALLVGFASSIVLARLLGPSDRGLLALLQSAVAVTVVIAGASLPFAVGYYISRSARQSAVLGGTLVWAAAMGLVLIPLAWRFEHPLAQLFAHGRGGGAWLLAAVLVPVTFLDFTTQQQLLGQKRFAFFNSIVVLAKVASLIGVVVLIGPLHMGVSGGVLALGLGSATTIGLATRRLAAGGRPVFDPALLRRMLRYGGLVQVGAIFTTLNYRLDVVILQFFRPLSAAGYYIVAQIMAELVTMLATGFAMSVMPMVAGAETELDSRALTLQSLRHHGVLTTVAIAIDAFFATAVIYWAYGPSFRAAIAPMLVLLPGMWFLGTGTVIANDLRGRGRPGTASALAGLAVCVTVALDLALIPPFGVIGAAVASVCAYTVLGVSSLVVLARIIHMPVRALLPARQDAVLYVGLLRDVVRRVRPASPSIDSAA